MKRTLAERDLYYLRSIKRHLDELQVWAAELGPPDTDVSALGMLALADNRDWLGDFIERMSPPTPPRSGGGLTGPG